MDPVSEQRLSLVCPTVAAKVRQMAAILLSDHQLEVRVVQGLRTVEEQDALFAQGRTAPGHIVTNAPGGHSWHNFGLAVDLAPDDLSKPGFQIDWNASHPQWALMEDVGRSVGFTAGADFKRLVDAPHFQLQGRFPLGAPDDKVRALYASGGLQAVWDEAQK